MKNFPALFQAEKNKKTGIVPIWIFQFRVGVTDYFISDSLFLVPGFVPDPTSNWPVSTDITTRPWVKTWGQVVEGITSGLNEFKISDFQLTCLADRAATPNMYDLATQNELEENTCSLYHSYLVDGTALPPQEMFRGFIRDSPCPNDYEVNIIAQDMSYKLNHYLGNKVTVDDYPWADPDDVGKIMPIVFGTVKKFPALAIRAGIKTSITGSITASIQTFNVSDATGIEPGMLFQIDEEQMLVVDMYDDTLTVIRGLNATLAAVHSKGAVIWEQVGQFDYLVADHPVTAIPKVYCMVGQTLLDISLLCTAWPDGDYPAYPGKAIVTVPGYVTVEQAIQLAIADGITVSNGTINAALSGDVTKSGSASLTGNVTKTGSATLTGDVTKSGSAVLSGGVSKTGSVTLSGLVALTGGVSDPGHYHLTGQSNSENTLTGLPTSYPAATQVSYPNGTWGMDGGVSTLYGLYIDFPNSGARTSCSYSITINFNYTTPSVKFFYVCNGTIYYTTLLNIVANSPFTCTFNTGSVNVDRIYIMNNFGGTLYFRVTSASRTIQLSSLVSGANSAYVGNGSLAASNGSLAAADGIAVANGTLAVTDNVGVVNSLQFNDGIGVGSTLQFTDQIGVVSTLAVGVTGNVSKSGTVTLTGNSVANTLVGDKILVDVISPTTDPGDCFTFISDNYCNGVIQSVYLPTAFPSEYKFNGAITEPKRAMEWFTLLALQTRAYFRLHLGVALLKMRADVLTSAKTIPSCVLKEDGTRAISRTKTLPQDVINKINLHYDKDWGKSDTRLPYKGVVKLVDQASIDRYGENEKPNLFNCDFITTYAMANSVAQFYISKYGARYWLNAFEEYLDMCELEFSDGVLQSFLDNKVCEVQEVRFSPGDASKMDKITIITKG